MRKNCLKIGVEKAMQKTCENHPKSHPKSMPKGSKKPSKKRCEKIIDFKRLHPQSALFARGGRAPVRGTKRPTERQPEEGNLKTHKTHSTLQHASGAFGPGADFQEGNFKKR